ncbi:MAG: glycosyltransferase [Ruminococcaceae bacterium]|nr:glycosyltransferase [Oscillospiraceae bacterium]
MEILNLIITIISKIVDFINGLYKYRDIYKITGIFATRKFKAAKKKHKYAILVAARNEETVIGNLIDSIAEQDYDKDLVTVFVVADNCTDNTAQIAREKGAICYERSDPDHRTKGYAVQYLVERIKEDFGIETFEGYFLFDADNLLRQDYITRMNESFDAGEKIITSYRNTKNFGDNWISASYGIHWLRTVRNEHRARSLFRLATRIQGTGFLFASEIIKDGWNYTSLTEDRAFCADAVANGYEITYNHDAIFYDEQPVSMKIAMRQRIRWAKGHLQAFVETGGKLLRHIFYVPKSVAKGRGIIGNIKLRFMSFDMLTVVFPSSLLSLFKKVSVFGLRVAIIFSTTNTVARLWMCPWLFQKLFAFFGIDNTANIPGINNDMYAVVWVFIFLFTWTLWSYIQQILTAAYVYIIEHKRIPKIKWYKKVWFCLTFPIFDMIGRLSMVIALFTKVEWKPIPHNSDVKISDMSDKYTTKT